MAAKQFKFVSPGVFINEIDNSQLPKESVKIGPVIIGRTERGPGMRPVTVESFSKYVEMFGNPIPGGQGGDVWRDGNYTAPTYAAYAAQAWLRNNTPATIVRLLGTQHTNATTAGEAGWETKDSDGTATALGTFDHNGGAYGLFIIDSSSYATGWYGATDYATQTDSAANYKPDLTPCTGVLAAIWYVNQGSIVLSGTVPGPNVDGAEAPLTLTGSALLVKSVGSDYEFKAIIRDGNSTVQKTTTFNFNSNSQKYIRKVFNTNPTLTNTSITLGANTASYWLGPTFERHVANILNSNSNSAGANYGIILGLKGDTAAKEGSDFRFGAQEAKTGWFFSQDLNIVGGAANSYQPENMTKLFRFHCLDTGEWTQQNIKISIEDIKSSTNESDPFGTFTVVLRQVSDSDNAPVFLERFTSCNLNPYSLNYVARKIGDKYLSWSDTTRRFTEYGNFDNQSRFIRIEMNQDVDAGAINPELLPFGVFGPPRHKGFAITSGSDNFLVSGASVEAGNTYSYAFVKGDGDVVRSPAIGTQQFYCGKVDFSGTFLFPAMTIRSSSATGDLASPQAAYFGLDTSKTSATTRFDPGYKDLVRPLPAGYSTYDPNFLDTEYSWIFTLDNLTGSGVHAGHLSGSRAAGTSLTAVASDNYKAVLDDGFNKFTSPLFGGFDGLDITEKEPFNNTDLESGTETTSYAFNSVKRAIDACKDSEVIESNIMVIPGLTHEGLTSHLLNVCEDRADSLGIIDLKGGFIPSTENTSGDSSATNRGDVDTTISNLKARGLNTSYGCCYYPWVQIRDTINGAILWAPPSIAGLGTMANSEKKTELWFAPAGFNRGGLTEGSAGIPVVGVREKLTSDQRDKLYEANINPIASFPHEGLVIYGQKTLQVTPSALDRINVRRLLIFLKKEISRMSANLLFEQNVQSTWNRFIGKVEPFLRSVKIRFGLSDYKVVLDETTTTPELIDRNVMYAKIFLKPAKAIEYIAIDFVITDSGASFAD